MKYWKESDIQSRANTSKNISDESLSPEKSSESIAAFGYYKRYNSYNDLMTQTKLISKVQEIKNKSGVTILDKEEVVKRYKKHPIINFLKEVFTSIDNPEGDLTQKAVWTKIGDVPVLVAKMVLESVVGSTTYINVSVWYTTDDKNLKHIVVGRGSLKGTKW